MAELAKILKEGAEELGIDINSEIIMQFKGYVEYLLKKNAFMNLTRIVETENVACLHFLDSMAILCTDNFEDAKVIDIGSGAGFPGLPIKITEPSIELTLLDAQEKRVDFMSELCKIISHDDVICIHNRAEELSHKPEMRESYDFALSRAVASLNILCELCLPFVKEGGAFLAMKSIDSDEEIKEAENAMKLLGAILERKHDYRVPCTDIIHRVVVIRKISESPKIYPRRFAKIQKKPL